MNPSNFSKWCADNLHAANVDRLRFGGAQVEVKRKVCNYVSPAGTECPYWAWLQDTEVRDGRLVETFVCDAGHQNISTRIL